jgi:isopenicillin-N N-acyltransferase-like protein
VGRAVELVCRVDLPEDEIERRLDAVETRLADEVPHVLEEAEGLAEGAGISRRDALVLSVASDLHGRLPGWCSVGALPGESGLLLGKNLDTNEEMGSVQVVERLAPEGALEYVHVTTAGAMWTDGGVNEAGLALVNASLDASSPNPGGLPDGILAREVLASCGDVPAAVALLERHGTMTLGENVLVGDGEGRAVVVEKLPGAQAVREAETIVACNHVLAARLSALMARGDPIRANSERRFGRLGELVGGRERWSVEDVAELLCDHGGVCQHGADGLWTVAAIVAEPRTRRLWVADGPPCLAPLVEIETELGRGGDERSWLAAASGEEEARDGS